MSSQLKLKLDKSKKTPVYRQIIEQITQAVKSGKLPAGSKLPPERELAQQLNTARGTINRAYEKLASNNIIEIIHGRGCFISKDQDVHAEGRKEKAVKMLERTIINLEKLNFSHREINSLFYLIMMERENRLANFNLAAIDCNPEALAIFEQQLLHITHGQMQKILIDSIVKDKDIKQKLKDYDLILTTQRHYTELLGLLPEYKDKIIQAAVSPSQQTIIDLATITLNAKIGIISRSKIFHNIIKNKLKDFNINVKNCQHAFEEQEDKISSIIQSSNILIMPPDSPLQEQRIYSNDLRSFLEKGGRIIKFEYQIERGTLIHIEERVSAIINSKSNGF